MPQKGMLVGLGTLREILGHETNVGFHFLAEEFLPCFILGGVGRRERFAETKRRERKAAQL